MHNFKDKIVILSFLSNVLRVLVSIFLNFSSSCLVTYEKKKKNNIGSNQGTNYVQNNPNKNIKLVLEVKWLASPPMTICLEIKVWLLSEIIYS